MGDFLADMIAESAQCCCLRPINYTYDASLRKFHRDSVVVFDTPETLINAVKHINGIRPGDVLHLPQILNSPFVVTSMWDDRIEGEIAIKREVNGETVYTRKGVYVSAMAVMAVLPGARVIDKSDPAYEAYKDMFYKTWEAPLEIKEVEDESAGR